MKFVNKLHLKSEKIALMLGILINYGTNIVKQFSFLTKNIFETDF